MSKKVVIIGKADLPLRFFSTRFIEDAEDEARCRAKKMPIRELEDNDAGVVYSNMFFQRPS